MSEVMEGIPELPEVARGGLQQALKNLIDDARMWGVKLLGAGKKQAVTYGFQRRSRRPLGKTEGRFLPSLWAKSTGGKPPDLDAPTDACVHAASRPSPCVKF
jgi:hypothetical protein